MLVFKKMWDILSTCCNYTMFIIFMYYYYSMALVLVGPWPPSRPSSSRLFYVHVSSSLWHPSSLGPPSHHPSTLTLVFLHPYFLLDCSGITSLPPFPHSSSPHVPAISIFLFSFFISVTMSSSPYNCLTSSFVLLLQYPATHIGPNIFLSTFLSQIRKLFSSFAVKHHAYEPYSTTGLILSHSCSPWKITNKWFTVLGWVLWGTAFIRCVLRIHPGSLYI